MIKTRAQFLHHFNLGKPSPTRYKTQLELRPSAVLIPLICRQNSIDVVFTRRSDHLRHHAGQICFPGGSQESSDKSLQDTALREYEEELGAPASDVSVVGQLPDMPVISRFMIRPYLGFIEKTPTWQPDADEVAEVFCVPLHELLRHQQHYAYQLPRFGMQRVWFIPWQQRLIWGATAAIVRSLAEQLQPQHSKLYRPLN